MPVTSKNFRRSAAATTSTTLYTQPSTTVTTVVTDILVTNTATTESTFTLAIAGISIASAVPVAANDTTVIQIKQVIPPTNPATTITGSASTTAVNFHISGVEIT